jgi:hypothetical protein
MTAPGDESRGARDAISRPETQWPKELASLGAIRFGRTYYHYNEAVHFFRDLVGLPLYEQFEGSYGENGSISGLPTLALTFEIVQGTAPIPASAYDARASTSPIRRRSRPPCLAWSLPAWNRQSPTRTGSQPGASPIAIPTTDRSYLRRSYTALMNLLCSHLIVVRLA